MIASLDLFSKKMFIVNSLLPEFVGASYIILSTLFFSYMNKTQQENYNAHVAIVIQYLLLPEGLQFHVISNKDECILMKILE